MEVENGNLTGVVSGQIILSRVLTLYVIITIGTLDRPITVYSNTYIVSLNTNFSCMDNDNHTIFIIVLT